MCLKKNKKNCKLYMIKDYETKITKMTTLLFSEHNKIKKGRTDIWGSLRKNIENLKKKLKIIFKKSTTWKSLLLFFLLFLSYSLLYVFVKFLISKNKRTFYKIMIFLH